jgi:hypothetical protein
LLASPLRGQGTPRLDLALRGHPDSFKADATRPNIWRYRDYVINAFNSDKPYDRFVREQIAGDELYPGDPEALVAMGFNRHWIDETNAAGLLTRRQETLDDITNVTGATFLGLTFGSQLQVYYVIAFSTRITTGCRAFFANTSFGDGPLPSRISRRAACEEQKAQWEEKTKDIRAEMSVILEPLRKSRSKAASRRSKTKCKRRS